MLIEQLTDLRKVRTENLKFRTGLQDRVMDSWSVLLSNPVDDYFEKQIAQKNLKIEN